MGTFKDVFISYGRADSKAFTIALSDRLMAAGVNVWVDFEDIPLAVDFQDQIDDGIEKADNFVFVIAPHSINSVFCRREIEHALRCKKRIIPLLQRPSLDRSTWQQRHPNDTDADWEEYQAKGLHWGDDRNPNMHKAIAQINWVPFIEGVSDFEDSFQKLLAIFARHRDYVHQHTVLFSKAQAWEQQQKQSSHLLIGDECQQAQAWLATTFKDEQPPCQPTDLHCEFISESIKGLSDLMTQVFLSYAEEDIVVQTQVRFSLMRQGLTIWTNKTDIQTGDGFQRAIERGIEEADNLVYLLSPASLQSEYCQLEINYALSLNKRIIPLLIHPVDMAQVPPALSSLQYIDLTDHEKPAAYNLGENQLLRILRQDAIYHTVHKFVLAKALKWQRQHRNPSLLVRGHNLSYVEAWLTAAKQRSQCLPTALQEDFIYTSLQQPPEQTLDVFVSYSRVNTDFARKLNDAIETQGKTTWFDQHTITPGSDFQQEIYRGIEASNQFLFILSPSSVNSPYCADEVEYAQKLNKRIVTVLYQPVDTARLHPALASIQWIDFNRYNRDFETNFAELVRTLETDQEYLRSHTRLSGRALEWERTRRDPSFLLRGTDLASSEQWLKQSAKLKPAPTDLQIEYIRTSRQSPLRRAKPWVVALTSLATTLGIVFIRAAGILQPLELAAFDRLLPLRPNEPPDPRLLVIEITEDDIQGMLQRNEKGKGSLSDESLDRLLQKLEAYQPRVIGLDLYREFKVDPAVPTLTTRLNQNERLIGVCKLRNKEAGKSVQRGTAPPKEIPPSQIGFSDVISDPDNVRRRQVVRVIPPADDPCQANQSLGFFLAHRYLEQEQGPALVYKDPVKDDGVLQLGQVVFPQLNSFAGGYQGIDASGFQLLVTYRTPNGDPAQIADRVTLGTFLGDGVPPDKQQAWKHRIVLIGITSRVSGEKDYVETPYGNIPGVMFHAQIASQILSAVLDRRPLLQVLPLIVDLLWIAAWSAIGGLLVYCQRSPLRLGLAGGAALLSLVGACITSLVAAHLWVPLMPPALVLVLTMGGVLYVTNQVQFKSARPDRDRPEPLHSKR